MRGVRPRALVALAGAWLLLACADAAPPERGSSADTAAAAVPSDSGDSAALSACDLIGEAELEEILALELEPGTLVNDYAGVSQCRWYLPGDRQRGVSISLYERGDLENYRRVPGSIGAPSVGDEAIWNASVGQLAVLEGERLVSVGLLVASPQRSHAEQIARTALRTF